MGNRGHTGEGGMGLKKMESPQPGQTQPHRPQLQGEAERDISFATLSPHPGSSTRD